MATVVWSSSCLSHPDSRLRPVSNRFHEPERAATYIQSLAPDPSQQTVDVERPQPLTYDEKKVAEAAFRGAPLNPAWSQSARQVYEGIFDAIIRMGIMWITPSKEELL